MIDWYEQDNDARSPLEQDLEDLAVMSRCDHADEHLAQAMLPDGGEKRGFVYCMNCGLEGMEELPDEDGEVFIDWSY